MVNEKQPLSDEMNEIGDVMKNEPAAESKEIVMNNEPRYPWQERRIPERFTINALRSVCI